MNKHSHLVRLNRAKEEPSSYPVYTSRSLLKPAPKKPLDGHEAIAIIDGRQVPVMFDTSIGSYVTPTIRIHGSAPRPNEMALA